MKKILKKVLSCFLAAALVIGTPFIGFAESVDVYASDNQALTAPINFLGLSNDDNWYELCQTIMSVDVGETEVFSKNYSYSYKIFIPKAVLSKNLSQVVVETWFDLSGEEEYYGSLSSKYAFQVVMDNNDVFPVIWNQDEEKELSEVQYKDFFNMDESGDFYVFTFTDAPLRNVMNVEDGEKDIDTTKGGFVNMRVRVTGNGKMTSIVYLDDFTAKADDSVICQIDFSAASMHERYYEYVVGEEKDENIVQRPILKNLNTDLLTLPKSSASIKAGKEIKIMALAAADGKITYKSSNKKVATVTAKGVVKGKKAGKANITVSANGISKTFKVTVKKK